MGMKRYKISKYNPKKIDGKIIQKEKMNSNDFEIMSNAIDKWYIKHYEK